MDDLTDLLRDREPGKTLPRALDGESTLPIEAFRLGRPAVSDAAFEKTFHA